MEKFIVTFGLGSPIKDRVQPIKASDIIEAEQLAMKIYGSNVAGCYPVKDFEESKHKGFFLDKEILPDIVGE